MTSKYSALPDIDDQPDVFETPDAGEESPVLSYDNQSSDDDDNENVIKSRVSVQDATTRFKGSIVDSTDTDFSDRLTRRKKQMYRTYVKRPPALESNEYEILPKQLSLEETPLQKLRRLMYEVQELNDEMEKAKEPADAKETISQSDILSQIAYLQSDLIRMNQQVGSSEVDDAPSTYGRSVEEAKALIKQLEAFKNAPPKTVAFEEDSNNNNNNDQKVPSFGDKNDMVTYELYYTPETAKLQKESKLSDVDDRIAKLEKLVGSSAGQALDDLPSSLVSSSLINTISKLEQQMVVIAQPRQLEMVARRVKVLNSDLDRLNELKAGRKDATSSLSFGLSSTTASSQTASGTAAAATPAAGGAEGANKEGINDSESKINQLFATLEKIDPLLNLTPALLTRLKALQSLHTEAASFSQSIKVISEEQTRMTDELKSLKSTSELLNKSLEENETSINSNIKVIDTRMTDLVQRISALSST